MKQITDYEEEIEDQEEIYFQSYEKYLKDVNILDIKLDKQVYKDVYSHCVNSYFDYTEPELEKNVMNCVRYYNLDNIIRSCDVMPVIFHHIDIHKMITKEYIVNNPECVHNYIHPKINNEEKKLIPNKDTSKKKDNQNFIKKFDWSTRKYIK